MNLSANSLHPPQKSTWRFVMYQIRYAYRNKHTSALGFWVHAISMVSLRTFSPSPLGISALVRTSTAYRKLAPLGSQRMDDHSWNWAFCLTKNIVNQLPAFYVRYQACRWNTAAPSATSSGPPDGQRTRDTLDPKESGLHYKSMISTDPPSTKSSLFSSTVGRQFG